MEQGAKVHKNTSKVNVRPILILLIGLGFVTVILLSLMLSTPKQNYPKGNGMQNAQGSGLKTQPDDASDSTLSAVVKGIDTENKQITLYDINRKETLTLSYTGGTNITDRYGQVIAISQIEIGSMVEAIYRKDKNKLTDMNISTKAWEYIGVSNLDINRTDRTMKITDTLYKYSDDIMVLDGQDFIPVADLKEQDELTVRGYEETIWSITVTRGHGTVVLEDYEDFLGDYITIGYESLQEITEGMEITVREGQFNLTVEEGEYSATKSIRVIRNETTYVSLADLGPEAPKNGRVTFEITPLGADLTIDEELTSYANPVELLYGKHDISVSLGGYTSYNGTLNVDSAGKTIKIDLPEASSTGEAAVSETDTQPESPPTDSGSDTETGNTGTDTSSDTKDSSSDTKDSSSDAADTSGNNSQSGETTDSGHLIHVQNPIGASVYIDGEYKGTSPCSFKKIIGAHVITFIEEGYETMSYTIETSDDGKNQYFTFPSLAVKTD